MLRALKITTSALLLFCAVWFAVNGVGVDNLVQSFSKFNVTAVSLIVAATIISTGLASVRLRMIAADFGYHLSFRDSLAALTLGQIGGFVMFQMIGQLIARGSFLKRRDVPAAGTVLITMQERISSAAVSLALALGGALYVFKEVSFELVGGGIEFIKIIAGLSVASIAAACVWRPQIIGFVLSIDSASVFRFVRSLALSLSVQLAMMAAYVLAAWALTPGIDLGKAAGASAIIMFAASIPISLAGWGVREMSAVAAMSAIGVNADSAFAMAITIGGLSVIIAVALAALSAGRIRSAERSDEVKGKTVRPPDDGGRLNEKMVAVLPVLAAVFVLFQVHLPTKSGVINVNLADPVAMLGGAMFLLAVARRRFTAWRAPYVDQLFLACTAAMTLALLIGAYRIGWTQWAFVNKYVGWFILLAYGATGSFAVSLGLNRFNKTFAIAGCAVIIFTALVEIIFANAAGYSTPKNGQFTGFAQNSNAFAFQCVLILATALSLESRQRVALVAIALVGVWFTSSRAGLGTAIIVLATSIGIHFLSRRRLVAGQINLRHLVLIGACGVAAMAASVFAFTILARTCSSSGAYVASIWCGFARFSTETRSVSNSDHFQSVISGLQMFLNHPIVGSGLGVFVRDSAAVNPEPIVIHSTPVWLLAEFGLVGAGTFFTTFAVIFWSAVSKIRQMDEARNQIVLILVGLGVMSTLHELLYQRAFWLLLGAALAASTSHQLKPPSALARSY